MKAGFSIINYIKADTEETLEKVIRAFKERLGAVEKREGFFGLTVLANKERLEVLVITYWRDREAFEKWVNSEEFKRAHEKARSRRLSGTTSQGVEYEVIEWIMKPTNTS
ncbi:MAG: antibiotic biosynthesis monooxygenase [Desulfurococcales archaeon]|nr:antibiotic biosynthesis monooxygenase [Desulfurococcales archaeon]